MKLTMVQFRRKNLRKLKPTIVMMTEENKLKELPKRSDTLIINSQERQF